MTRETRTLLKWIGGAYFGLGVYLTLSNLKSINRQRADFERMAADVKAIRALVEGRK
jgi:hypothetical protein